MEKKLTDEEIVKVLDTCFMAGGNGDCGKCGLFTGNGLGECMRTVAVETLDLIHRLQEENERLTELQEYRSKIEQGKMIELPCKVGDKVYVIEYKGRFVGFKVGEDYCNSITFDGDKFWVNREVYEYDGFDGYVFGEYAFLTCEEAEKRLKELQNG